MKSEPRIECVRQIIFSSSGSKKNYEHICVDQKNQDPELELERVTSETSRHNNSGNGLSRRFVRGREYARAKVQDTTNVESQPSGVV